MSNKTQPGTVVNTPITAMMELRNWHQSKINATFVNSELTKDHPNVLSDTLLGILEFGETKKQELCDKVAQDTTRLVNLVMEGLAKKQFSHS